MARGLYLAGTVLGILGLLWSGVLLLAYLLVTVLTFGSEAALLAVPIVGIPAAVVAIMAARRAGRGERLGALLLLAAGVAVLLAALLVPFAIVEADLLLQELPRFALTAGWWAAGLVVVGSVGLWRGRGEAEKAA